MIYYIVYTYIINYNMYNLSSIIYIGYSNIYIKYLDHMQSVGKQTVSLSVIDMYLILMLITLCITHINH